MVLRTLYHKVMREARPASAANAMMMYTAVNNVNQRRSCGGVVGNHHPSVSVSVSSVGVSASAGVSGVQCVL